MRVSIVATALDGHQTETKTVLNMVNRIHNRNTGNSDGLFSKSTHIENNTFNSISGATALKLDEQFDTEQSKERELEVETNKEVSSDISMENATYIENNIDQSELSNQETHQDPIISSENIEEEYTPQLFSDENETNLEVKNNEINENKSENELAENEKLFDQETDEEDFEIPAFLRRQKF